jgi:hypothetical protein
VNGKFFPVVPPWNNRQLPVGAAASPSQVMRKMKAGSLANLVNMAARLHLISAAR